MRLIFNLLTGVLILSLAFNPGLASGATSPRSTEISPGTGNDEDPLERDFKKVMELDDAAQDEVDQMIKEAGALKEADPQASTLKEATLNSRILQRYAPVRKAYEDFIRRNPRHARAELAYGSFLCDLHEEDEGVRHMERARELDPRNPAVWNNLANYHGHHGTVKKAFEYYGKAIELAPNEPVYLQNLATTVYLFRTDAKELYGLTEEKVFDKSLELYRRAIQLDPKSFTLATDYAQSYYGIKPLRTGDALKAWKHAAEIAGDAIEREGVYLHMARVELNSGLFEAARQHLNLVTNEMYHVLKDRLVRNLADKESKTDSTNPVPSDPAKVK